MQPTDIGPVNAALKRRWGVVSTLGPIVTIGSDIFPTARADLGMDADLHYLADQRICAAGRQDSATVSLQSSVGLENPAGSGIIAIVTALHGRAPNGASGAITLSQGTAVSVPFDSEVNGAVRDSRPQARGEGSLSVCIIGSRTAAAAGNGLQVANPRFSNEGSDLSTLGPWVLGPDSRLTVNLEVTNTAIRVDFSWIERTLGKWEV